MENTKPNILTYLTIGDWSEDSHEEYEKVYFKVNYPVETIRQAYKDSCLKTGVQFNHNENYTGTEKRRIYDQIWTEYKNNAIRPNEVATLRQFNVINDEYLVKQQLEETEDHHIFVTNPKMQQTSSCDSSHYPCQMTSYTKNTQSLLSISTAGGTAI